MMQAQQLPILILQSTNIIITIIFFILFMIRYLKIRTMGVTNKYLDSNWRIRLAITLIYIIISAIMLSFYLIVNNNDGDWKMNLIETGSVGFCINSIILIIHIIVLNQQLKRQLPSALLHQVFIIYLFIISILRLAISLYQVQIEPNNNQLRYKSIIFTLAALLVFISLFNIIFWFKTKKRLPIFQNYTNVDINTITQRITNPILYEHNSINLGKLSIDRWNLIFPNVTVQLGKVRIILEMYTDDQILRSLTQEETKTYDNHHVYNKNSKQNTNKQNTNKQGNIKHKQSKQSSDSSSHQYYKSLVSNCHKNNSNKHLQIISDHTYTFKQIQNIYLICARYELQNKLTFQNTSVANFYRQVKKYMEQLWTIKQVYIQEIFLLFKIDKQAILQLNKKIDKLIKSKDQLLISSFVDINSLFLSVEIFKQLWTKDHFIFYIHTITMDHKDKSVCYKRFHQFQDFHNKLQIIVEQTLKNTYKLPSLPKKHIFSWSISDQQKATERRKQLQNYCRQTFNDFNIMTKMPRARQLIFQFLGLKRVFDIIPNTKKSIQFYSDLQIIKGNIYKALVQEQYVTFYQFQLYRNGILLRSINKRFRQFIALHQSINRWMDNSQILYKLIVLPQKHLYKSQSKRHQKLLNYLQSIISINDVYKIYAVNKFFNMGQKYDIDSSGFGMSIIRRQSQEQSSIHQNQNQYQNQRENQNKQIDRNHQFSRQSDKQRMSLMIQQLGDQ